MFKQDISLKINFWQVVFVKFLIGPNDLAHNGRTDEC